MQAEWLYIRNPLWQKEKRPQKSIPLIPKGDTIEVLGAREHNLKNIDISIPKNQLVVFTGVSGSGKSSLAFDTLYNEGQRRYMESFSAYARQFMGDLEGPDVDQITGLSPVISIEQKTTNKNPRSTVGTVTEIYDFMRLLFARAADAYSFNTGKQMVKFSEDEIVANVFEKYKAQKISILAPIVKGRKGHYRELFEDLRKKGYLKVRVDGEIKDLTAKMQVDRYKIHDIELVVDRLAATDDMKVRLSQSIQKAMQLGKGQTMIHLQETDKVVSYSNTLMCAETGISYDEPSPNSFSFNSPYGACPSCKGLGTVYTIDMQAVIPDTAKTIAEGGIEPLGEEREAWIYKQVAQLAKKHKINLKKPISEISQSQLNIILYGKDTPDADDLGLQWNDEGPGNSTGGYFDTVFEGVIPMIKRWFNSSSSESIRSWAEGFMKMDTCPECNGARLRKESLWFKIDNKNISELSAYDLDELMDWFVGIEKRISNRQQTIAKEVLKEIRDRLQFLLNVGLNYLSINRPTRTLSGGESQRIRLATQIGSQLQGITYILDEPSIGLHQRDNHRLIEALKNLRDIGNSVLVVEHDKDIMLASDHLVDIGPKAGRHGGTIVASGTPEEVLKSNSDTAQYLNGTKKIAVPEQRRKGTGKSIELKGVTGNNLKNVSIKLPLGQLIVVSGVSGSGKSTLINETLYPLLSNHSFKASRMTAMPFKSIKGLEHIDKVIEIDQSPIGRTPRSNPATYCGFFTEIEPCFQPYPKQKSAATNRGVFHSTSRGAVVKYAKAVVCV
jgi:excinuclease ABC subunit A